MRPKKKKKVHNNHHPGRRITINHHHHGSPLSPALAEDVTSNSKQLCHQDSSSTSSDTEI